MVVLHFAQIDALQKEVGCLSVLARREAEGGGFVLPACDFGAAAARPRAGACDYPPREGTGAARTSAGFTPAWSASASSRSRPMAVSPIRPSTARPESM